MAEGVLWLGSQPRYSPKGKKLKDSAASIEVLGVTPNFKTPSLSELPVAQIVMPEKKIMA
jgi:hypothetical protein